MIDDLDRCLPHTVVDTFEAIRLFLNVDKRAFVIATHAEVEAQLAEAFREQARDWHEATLLRACIATLWSAAL
ncbi:P-loop NTPase fold protein [Streptomyces sp. NPDC002870]|uniref:P-loop NTPase fold protein n=1 Tax=Streptomyces sp. NPDC002870 TaxID=3364666 RepID=UPI0036A4B277